MRIRSRVRYPRKEEVDCDKIVELKRKYPDMAYSVIALRVGCSPAHARRVALGLASVGRVGKGEGGVDS